MQSREGEGGDVVVDINGLGSGQGSREYGCGYGQDGGLDMERSFGVRGTRNMYVLRKHAGLCRCGAAYLHCSKPPIHTIQGGMREQLQPYCCSKVARRPCSVHMWCSPLCCCRPGATSLPHVQAFV